jgi:DnaJ-class molecular chaperone
MDENRYRNPRERDDREVTYCGECWGTGKLELEHWSPGGIELCLAICGACGGSGIRSGPRGPDTVN